jgi:hypothetical protein
MSWTSSSSARLVSRFHGGSLQGVNVFNILGTQKKINLHRHVAKRMLCNEVQKLQTKVTFGSDGTPTVGSFSVLAGEVADLEKVDPSSVDMDYFKTSTAETAALDQYLYSVKGTRSLYVVGVHDCIFVCLTALGRAGIGKNPELFDVPRWVIWNLGFTADSTYSGESGEKEENDRNRNTPDVHSTIHFCTNENDSSCQQ